MLTWFTILILALVFILTCLLLFIFPTKQTPVHVYLFVFVGWFTAFVIVTLIPYDVALARGGEGNKDFLYTCWRIVYWTVFCLCWFIMPVTMNYHQAGQFTRISKFQRAMFVYLRYHLIVAAIAGAFVLYVVIVHNFKM